MRPTRLVAPLALLVAVVAVAVLLTGAGSKYVLHAQFYDAGQLVPGDQVTVGRFDLYFLILHGTGAPEHQRAPGAVA